MAEGKVLPYLDMPLQHASPTVLKRMRRPATRRRCWRRIRSWRTTCPDLAIRSTFIVGFPGETEEEFEELLTWLKEAKLERVGCFQYEPVRGRARERGGGGGAGRGEGRAPAPLHGDAAGGLAQAPEGQGRQAPAGDHRRRRSHRRQGPLEVRRPARSTATSTSPSAARPGGDIVTVKIESADAYDLHGVAV